MNDSMPSGASAIALQRCDRFVARTMNWLYDHLRFVPRYTPLVVCDALENRAEYPELTAWRFDRQALLRRISRKLLHKDVDPLGLRRLRRQAPRVMHSHFGYVAADDYALWQSLRVPWLIGFYGADVYQLGRRPEWRARYAEIFRVCSRALALGPTMAHQLEQLGCPREKIQVHALGVDVSALPYTPRVWNPGEPLKILFAGTLREKKGAQYALQGAAAARKAGVDLEFHLVAEAANKPGDRETEAEVSRLIDKLDMRSSVVRHTFMPFQELLALGLRTHVFLAPSVTAADGDSEGTPFVLQQMMATGMPAIATQHSDTPYIFGSLSHLLVPERDAQAITDRLISYGSNRQLLLEHGEQLRKQILAHFDIRDCAARLSNIYDAVV